MGGILGGLVGGAAGGALSYFTAKALQEDAQQYATNFYERRYQRQMEDMRKAGLNPILSYRTGAPGQGGAQGIASAGGIAQSISGGVQAGAKATEAVSAKGVRAEQEKLLREQTITERTQQIKNNMQSSEASAKGHLASAQAENTRTELAKKRLQQRFYGDPKKGRAAVWAQEVGTSAKSIWSPFMRAK